MTLRVSSWRSLVGFRYSLIVSIILAILCQAACSVPKLETDECSQARDAVKRFYSFHIAGDMRPSEENLAARSHFLTPELVAMLSMVRDESGDYFTASDNFPRAFRVGECNAVSEGRTRLSVLLLWRDDTSTDQRTISVATVRSGEKWLIDEISN